MRACAGVRLSLQRSVLAASSLPLLLPASKLVGLAGLQLGSRNPAPHAQGGSAPGDFDAGGASNRHVVKDIDNKQYLMFYEAVGQDGGRCIGLAVSQVRAARSDGALQLAGAGHGEGRREASGVQGLLRCKLRRLLLLLLVVMVESAELGGSGLQHSTQATPGARASARRTGWVGGSGALPLCSPLLPRRAPGTTGRWARHAPCP